MGAVKLRVDQAERLENKMYGSKKNIIADAIRRYNRGELKSVTQNDTFNTKGEIVLQFTGARSEKFVTTLKTISVRGKFKYNSESIRAIMDAYFSMIDENVKRIQPTLDEYDRNAEAFINAYQIRHDTEIALESIINHKDIEHANRILSSI